MPYYEIMSGNSLGYEFLAPTEPLGILILSIGILFTGMIFFYFFFNCKSRQ